MNSRTIQILSTALFALLVVWGLYTLLVYLGVPYHGAALVNDDFPQTLTTFCEPTAYVCRGILTVWPAFLKTITSAEPFLWYAVLSLIAYACLLGWRWYGTGKLSTIRIRWTPWKLLLLGVASTWLISTVLSFGTVNGKPERYYIDPTKDTYNVSEHTLMTLQDDTRMMLARGCLGDTGLTTQSNAKVYQLEPWCMEKAFVERVMTQMLFILALLFEFLMLGRMALRGLLRLTKRSIPEWSGFPSLLLESLFSAGMGAGLMIVLLWILAVVGIYVSTAGWILAVIIPIICFPHARYWIKRFLSHSWDCEYRSWDVSLLLGWLLVSYLALNFLEVVRPFPIGWDDLGSYLNRPRLLVSYGHFLYSMSGFDWTYLTSLGFLLFGYNATFGSTASMLVNWSAGLLATVSVFAFAQTFLGKRAGVLSALLYYTLPLVGHFSFADMKIDNAVFFFGALGTLAVFLTLFPNETTSDEQHSPLSAPHFAETLLLLALSGFFCGFAFATKATAIMLVFALLSVIAGALLHWSVFVGALLVSFAVFSYQRVLSVTDIAARIGFVLQGRSADMVFGALCLAVAVAVSIVPILRRRGMVKKALLSCGIFIAGFAVSIAPWVEHNNIALGLVIPRLEFSAPSPVDPVSIDDLKGDLAVNRDASECKPSGTKEELDRYWGYEHGWSHYLTLPWRTVMNIDATGYYVTTIPALLLFPLLLLLPFFWTKRGEWVRWLTWGTGMMILEWMFLANGIPWYGVSMLLGLVIGLEVLLRKAPDLPNRIAMGTLIICSLMIAFGLRFWQFSQQRNIFEYSMGKISADAMREITIPYYDGISATVMDRHQTMPDRPYLYRIGTFIAYFIPKNLEVIATNDHQLDVFNCLYQERNPELTVKRLKALGFNSIVFDTNTATIEKDEQGSLHKKVNAFVDFVNNPKAKLQIVVSDTNAGIAYILIP